MAQLQVAAQTGQGVVAGMGDAAVQNQVQPHLHRADLRPGNPDLEAFTQLGRCVRHRERIHRPALQPRLYGGAGGQCLRPQHPGGQVDLGAGMAGQQRRMGIARRLRAGAEHGARKRLAAALHQPADRLKGRHRPVGGDGVLPAGAGQGDGAGIATAGDTRSTLRGDKAGLRLAGNQQQGGGPCR